MTPCADVQNKGNKTFFRIVSEMTGVGPETNATDVTGTLNQHPMQLGHPACKDCNQ